MILKFKQLSLLPLLLWSISVMSNSIDTQKSSIPTSIERYRINGNTFEIYKTLSRVFNNEAGYRVYFIKNNQRYDIFKDIFDWGFDGEEFFDDDGSGTNQYAGVKMSILIDEEGLSPDRKFLTIISIEYYGSEMDGALRNASNYHELYKCNFVSTETGEIVDYGTSIDCVFKWDTVYSGQLILKDLVDDDGNTLVRSLLDKEESPQKIHYSNLSSVIKQVEPLYHAKNYAKIREIAEKTIIDLSAISSKNVTALNNLGYYYSEAGAYVEALQILSAVTKKFYDRAVACLNLADTYRYMKNMDTAKFYYRQYITIMSESGKQDKIPQRVLALFDGQSVEEILKD